MERIWENMDLVEQCARRAGVDDALAAQEGLDALHRALANFDEARGTTFRAYARKCVMNAMLSVRRREQKHRGIDGNDMVYEALHNETSGQDTDPAHLLRELREKLTDEELYIVHEHLVCGRRLEDIGVELGVIKQTIWGRLQRALRKARGC